MSACLASPKAKTTNLLELTPAATLLFASHKKRWMEHLGYFVGATLGKTNKSDRGKKNKPILTDMSKQRDNG